MVSFYPKNSRNERSYYNFKEPIIMAVKNLTLEQATSLHAQGIITDEAFEKLVSSGDMKIFRFRKVSDDKPDIVKEINSKLIKFIEGNAFALFQAGFKPSISWMKLKTDEETETE